MLSRSTRILHWLSALALLSLLAFGFWIGTLPRGPDKVAMIQLHKSFGMIVLVLLVIRLAWRLKEGFPPEAEPAPAWRRALARTTHWLLLLVPIGMVASGIVRSLAYARSVDVFGVPVVTKLLAVKNESLNAAAGAVHDALALVLIAAIGLHIAGALLHHMNGAPTLKRMLGSA